MSAFCGDCSRGLAEKSTSYGLRFKSVYSNTFKNKHVLRSLSVVTHGISHANGLSKPRTICFLPVLIFPPSSLQGPIQQIPTSQWPRCATLKHINPLAELNDQHNVDSGVLQLCNFIFEPAVNPEIWLKMYVFPKS